MQIKCLTPFLLWAQPSEMPPAMIDCPDLVENPDYWKSVQYVGQAVRYLLPDSKTIEIRQWFPSDGASIPSLFASLTYERYDWPVIRGALLHDFLYAAQLSDYDRETADGFIRQLWIDYGVPKLKADQMWAALRLGGRSPWDERTSGIEWYRKFGTISKKEV